MRVLLQITLCCLLAGGAIAQRRGMGGFGGGFHGGGIAGGGFHGSIGGFGRGTFVGGFRGGFSGFRGGFFNRGFGFGGFYGGYYPSYALYSPWWGYDYSYPYYGYGYGYSYPVYEPSPNVTVVYPAAQPALTTVYVERANPTMHSYDQYGQEIAPPAAGGQAAGSPIYLIAFKDGVIRAAASYSVAGNTLRYVTLQHEEKQAPIETVDRNLSLQLNRERHVAFQLPE